MNSAAQNKIETSIFNFEYENKAAAIRSNILIENVFNTHILPKLEEAISNAIPPGVVLEIPKLEIDIGKIKEKELQDILGDQIKKVLQNALYDCLQAKKDFRFFNTKVMRNNPQYYMLEAIEVYLIKGYLPSWIDTSITLETIITNSISEFPTEFKQLLIDYGRYEAVNQRMANTISIPLFDKITAIVDPINST